MNTTKDNGRPMVIAQKNLWMTGTPHICVLLSIDRQTTHHGGCLKEGFCLCGVFRQTLDSDEQADRSLLNGPVYQKRKREFVYRTCELEWSWRTIYMAHVLESAVGLDIRFFSFLSPSQFSQKVPDCLTLSGVHSSL